MKRGFFGERPASPGATMLHQAARVAAKEPGEPVMALVLVWDADKQPEGRREGLAQGRREALALAVDGFEIVVGCPEPNRESWVLAGFVPRDDDEGARLERERQRLGLWPHERPQELTAQDEGALKNTKRVLRVVTNGDVAREARCSAETPLDDLRVRGQGNGLADYLRDVEVQLCPQVDGVARGVTPR